MLRRVRPLLILLLVSLPLQLLASIDTICQITPTASAAAIAKQYGITLVAQTKGAPFVLFSVPDNLVDSVENGFSKDTRIVWFEQNEDVGLSDTDTNSKGGVVPVIGDGTTLKVGNTHLLSQIGWNSTVAAASTKRVRVAVLDTGLSPLARPVWSHVVYLNSFVPGNPYGLDLPNPRLSMTDPRNLAVGHGTMVTGLIEQIAPNSDFLIEQVADSSGRATSWSVISGLADAVVHKAAVINISLGAPGPIIAFEQVFEWAARQGVAIVAPIGNSDLNTAFEPASLDNVLCVAGVDGSDHKASFSNWSNRTDISAPAVAIESYYWNGQIGIWSGTSFSSPMAAGALVLALGQVTATPQALYEILAQSGDNIDPLNPTYVHGLGRRLNIANFIANLINPNN